MYFHAETREKSQKKCNVDAITFATCCTVTECVGAETYDDSPSLSLRFVYVYAHCILGQGRFWTLERFLHIEIFNGLPGFKHALNRMCTVSAVLFADDAAEEDEEVR